jgi:hypothetical protein
MDIVFLLLGVALWGLMGLLVCGLKRLEPGKAERP